MPATHIRRPRSRKRRARPALSKKRRVVPEDLLKYQLVSDPQISPDGSRIVFVKKHVGEKNDYVTNLWMVGAAGKSQPRQFTSSGKDSQPRWSPDGQRIAFISGRDKPRPQVWLIPSSGGEATALSKFPEGSLGALRWSRDCRTIAAIFREQDPQWTEKARNDRKENGLSDPPRVLDDWWYRLDGDGYFIAQRHHLYLIDVETGAHRAIWSRDTLGHFSFDFSPDSKQLVVSTNRDRLAMTRPWSCELIRIDVATGRATTIPNLPDGPKDKVIWSPNGKLIAYAGREGKTGLYDTNNVELWVCDALKGHARCLTNKDDYCLMGVAISDSTEVAFAANICWSPDSRRVFMQIGWHGESHIASVAATGGRVRFHTSGARMHNMGNLSGDGKSMAMTIGSATRLDEIHVGKVNGTMRPRTLSDFNGPLLSELALAKPQAVWVKAEDGHASHLWIMRPPHLAASSNGHRCPAVVEIHGGPHAQYGVGYFHEFQCLCAAGYGVFFSNPRGSKGYGRDHCHAIRGSWGDKDWLDIQAVRDFMKAQPWVNPKRLGVMGGSYGGYMTNWVIGHTNDFAGAITDRCVTNLVSMFGTSDYTDAPDMYWPGNSWDRTEEMWRMSPQKYLGNCTTPTLIIHSEGDLRCNVAQSEEVFTALKLNDVPTRLVRYPTSTSHGMSRSGPADMRLHRLHQILNWWKKWLK